MSDQVIDRFAIAAPPHHLPARPVLLLMPLDALADQGAGCVSRLRTPEAYTLTALTASGSPKRCSLARHQRAFRRPRAPMVPISSLRSQAQCVKRANHSDDVAAKRQRIEQGAIRWRRTLHYGRILSGSKHAVAAESGADELRAPRKSTLV